MRIEKTSRGFEIIRFTDVYSEECSLQESSLADFGAMWFGCQEKRMHLDKKLLRRLLPHLNAWLETGSLKLPKKDMVKDNE